MRWIFALSVFTLASCKAIAPAGQDPPAPASPSAPSPTPSGLLLPPEDPPPGSGEFKTDFSRHIVPYSEVLHGGPPKDGIPAIDEPRFVRVAEADAWLEPQEPVIALRVDGQARAYPIQVVIWHELVNDTIGDTPVVVTFCPLCNTAIAFSRRVGERVHDFGATGRLRNSNLIMYDRQTETWWQQATGRAIAGTLVGKTLDFVAAEMIAWKAFRDAHPDGAVLSKQTGHARAYGKNPYAGYDDVSQPPFLFRGSTPEVLAPVERVLSVDLEQQPVAYPYRVLKKERVVNDQVGKQPIVVLWTKGTASALDARHIPDGRDVGSARAYSRRHDGKVLTFEARGDGFFDVETHTRWNPSGVATDGPLRGAVLRPVVAINHFWFSWAAFEPQTRVYGMK